MAGDDIGKFTIKSIDDVRTLNKTLHFRPAGNLLNINELASLWEEKIGRKLPRVTVSEDDLLTAAKGTYLLYIYITRISKIMEMIPHDTKNYYYYYYLINSLEL